MDPLTLIVSAVVLGVSTGVGTVAAKSVTDAYAGLKSLITGRFASDAKAVQTLTDFEVDPATHEASLSNQLREAGLDKDAEVIDAARRVLELGNSAGVKPKYQVAVSGSAKVGIVGDGGHVGSIN